MTPTEAARIVEEILLAGVDAVRPEVCLPAALRCASAGADLVLQATDVRNGAVTTAHVPAGGQVALLCLGKCAAGAAVTLRAMLGGVVSRALVVDRVEAEARLAAAPGIEFLPGGHPLPDERSLAAGRRARDFVASVLPQELLLVCLSGGASALVELPARGVPGEWLAKVPAALMHAGGDIHALLGVRAAMSALKCGGLLERLPSGVAVLLLVLSDVAGDDPADVGGAPFYPPVSGRLQAFLDRSLVRYGDLLPEGALAWLSTTGRRRLRPQHVQPPPHVVVATGALARRAALTAAAARGLVAEDLGEHYGTPAEVATALLSWARSRAAARVGIMGGEAVAEVRGSGRGGPNLEVVAECMAACAAGHFLAVGSADTDGVDGCTDLAGAAVWPELAARLQGGVVDALHLSDSASLFQQEGALRWGPTGANASDLRAVIRI
jgi:hydroxypyruvate reductase